MKVLTQLIVMMALIFFGGIAGAATPGDSNSVPLQLSSEVKDQSCEILLANANDLSEEELALEITKRGCCSHHKGVCGCGGTKLRCCDGTLSPSCRCVVPNVGKGPMTEDISGQGMEG